MDRQELDKAFAEQGGTEQGEGGGRYGVLRRGSQEQQRHV